MVNDVSRGLGVGTRSTRTAGAHREDVNKELEALQNQAAKLAEIMSGSMDSVEISDEARTLSEAAKAIQEQNTTRAAAMGTKEGREAIATNYNTVLDKLRSQYGEEEAMRRFDKYMESQGFEKVESDVIGVFGNGVGKSSSTDPNSRFGGSLIVERADSGGKVSNALSRNGVTFNSDSNLHLRSTIKADRINGKNEYLAETTATFAVEYSDEVLDAIDSFFNRNIDDLQKQVGFDLAKEMEKHSPTGQISAVSVNKNLGSILQRAGVEIGAGESISIRLATDENGVVSGLSVSDGALQKVLDKAISSDPSILRAFAAEYSRVEPNVDSLNGQYSGTGSSVDYVHAGREFILSGDDPSAVIMADKVGVQSTGYTYQKKVSGSFDPAADSVSAMVRGGGDELVREIDNALKSGTTIESTVGEEEFNALPSGSDGMDERIRKLYEPRRESSFYVDPEMIRRQMEAVAEGKDPMAIAEEYDTRNEPEDVFSDSGDIISYEDGKNNARQMTFSAIMEMLKSQRGIFGGNILGMLSKLN